MKERDPIEELDREDLLQVASLVRDLPDDEPSMAWRAQLNAKLEAVTPRRRRWSLNWPVWSGAVATAAVCAVVFFGNRPAVKSNSQELATSMAAEIVNAHAESVARHDLGLATSSDLKADRGVPTVDYDWDMVDLSTL